MVQELANLVQESSTRLLREIVTAKTDTANRFHFRLCHALTLSQIKRHNRETILPKLVPQTKGFVVCTKSKLRKRYQVVLTKSKPLSHLHAETKGKIRKAPENGHKYFATIVYECSRYVHTVPVRMKSEASDALLSFVKKFEKQSVTFFIHRWQTGISEGIIRSAGRWG